MKRYLLFLLPLAAAACTLDVGRPLLPPDQVQLVAGQGLIEVSWGTPAEPEATLASLLYSSSGDPAQGGRRLDGVSSPWVLSSGILPGQTWGVRVVLSAASGEALSPLLQARPLPVGLFSTAATWVLAGEAAGGRFGAAVVFAGDVNGDGLGDLLVGAPGEAFGGVAGSGSSYLFRGASPPALDTGWTVGGGAPGEGFGSSLLGNGPDPDGFSDVLLGSPEALCPSGTGVCGVVQLVRGGLKGPFLPPLLLASGGIGVHAGSSLAVGDVHGNGATDVLVLGTGSGGAAGRAVLLPGTAYGFPSPATWSVTLAAGGSARAAITDLDHDGNADIALSQPFAGATGSLTLYPGGQTPSTTGQTLPSLPGDSHFGVGLAAVGDVNGDGNRDLMAATVSSAGGAVWLVLGGSTNGSGALAHRSGWSYPITSLGDAGLSSILSAAGDVNGDGLGDVLVGDPHAGSDRGAIYLFLGASGGLSPTPLWSAQGPTVGARFGTAVSAGDVNGDGLIDLLVGAPGIAPGGAVTIFRGLPHTGPVVWAGAPYGAQAGRSFLPDQAGFNAPPGSYLCVWDWGDGSLEDAGSCGPGGSGSLSHTYASPGQYSARLCVTLSQEVACPGASQFGEAVTTVYVH